MKARDGIAALPAALGQRLNCPGGYEVKAFGLMPVRRPNRLAAGMQFTNRRRLARPLAPGDRLSPDALALVVYGTTDKLRGLGLFHARRGPCPCCHAKTGGLVLTDSGKVRLRAARRRAAERAAA